MAEARAAVGGTADPAVRNAIAAGRDRFVADLVEWLRIPSVSADPARHADVTRSAMWLADALRRTGFPVVETWATADDRPAVYAEWPSADSDAPTVLVYGHSDVQPALVEDGWRTDPFDPVFDDGGDLLRARGAADDKGHVLFHTLAVRAHLEATGRSTPAVNLKLLVESEEEIGSPHFATLLHEQRERLGCDVVVVSDTGMWARDVPTTVTAMRGMVTGEVRLTGPETDVHSGAFGGAIPNPLTALVQLLGRLHDGHGRVTLPGFYDDVLEPGEDERDIVSRLPFDEAAWLRNARSQATAGESGWSTLERVWMRPTAEVNGVWGGWTGAGPKTIVPASAHAKLSFRLVADQDPATVQQQVRNWLAANVPEGIGWDVRFDGNGVRACATPLDHPALQAVVRSLSRAFEREVLMTREGGSGPEADLQDVLDAPVVFLGTMLPDDGWHAPNEKVDIPMLLKGAEAAAYLWADLGGAAEQLRHAAAASVSGPMPAAAAASGVAG